MSLSFPANENSLKRVYRRVKKRKILPRMKSERHSMQSKNLYSISINKKEKFFKMFSFGFAPAYVFKIIRFSNKSRKHHCYNKIKLVFIVIFYILLSTE